MPTLVGPSVRPLVRPSVEGQFASKKKNTLSKILVRELRFDTSLTKTTAGRSEFNFEANAGDTFLQILHSIDVCYIVHSINLGFHN